MSTGSAASGPSPSGSRARALLRRVLALPRSRAFRVGFLVLALGLAVVAVAADWDAFSATVTRLGPLVVLGAVGGAVLNVLTAGLAWRALLADIGSGLPVFKAMRVFLIGQLGKYVPGSVWNVVAQAELASDYGVPRGRTATASLIQLGMSVAVAASLAVPAVTLLLDLGPVRWAALAVLPLTLVVLSPRLMNAVVSRGVKVLRRPPPEHPLTAGGVLRAGWWTLLSWVGLGLQLLVLLVGAGVPLGWQSVTAGLSGFALAWVVGFLVVFAPAGAGPRELMLVLVLAPLLSSGEALAVVVVSRVVTTVVDVGMAGLAALLGHRPGGAAVRRAAAAEVVADGPAGAGPATGRGPGKDPRRL